MSKNKATTTTASPTPEPDASTALAPVDSADELADLGHELDDAGDGLGEIDRDDIRIPSRMLNCRRLDENKRPIPDDVYYDTVTQTQSREIRAAFVLRHKAKRYDYYDNEAKRTRLVCRSSDRITGTLNHDDGSTSTRPCKGCPDDQWYTDDEGKRRKHCSPVSNMFAVDLATRQPFVVRYKRTSLPALKTYLQRYHLGRRPLAGRMGNYPLYVFELVLGAQMSHDGTHAIPVLTKVGRLPLDVIKGLEQSSKALEEYVRSGSNLERIDDADTSDSGDTSFDPDSFKSNEPGDKYVDNDKAKD